jgi:hypothetical protein
MAAALSGLSPPAGPPDGPHDRGPGIRGVARPLHHRRPGDPARGLSRSAPEATRPAAEAGARREIQRRPWYVLPEEWLVSGESYVRNLRLGRQIARDFGGRPSNAGFACDLFGHIGQLPQIFAGFGINGRPDLAGNRTARDGSFPLGGRGRHPPADLSFRPRRLRRIRLRGPARHAARHLVRRGALPRRSPALHQRGGGPVTASAGPDLRRLRSPRV